jgi:hypothetical protein
MSTKDKLRQAAISVLSDYMGVAAEFVVDDAWDEVEKTVGASASASAALFFFSALGKQLPPEVPYLKVKESIAKLAGVRI